MLWEQTQFGVCATSFQEISLLTAPHPPEASFSAPSLQSPCLHTHIRR